MLLKPEIYYFDNPYRTVSYALSFSEPLYWFKGENLLNVTVSQYVNIMFLYRNAHGDILSLIGCPVNGT